MAGYWLLFAGLAPWVVKSINLEFGEFSTIAKRKVTIPDPNQAYHELMAVLDVNSPSKGTIYRLIGLVMPEDLPGLLQKWMNSELREYRDYNRLPSAKISEQEKAGLEKPREQSRSLNDNDLADLILCCGRDTAGIISGFMDDPNINRALVSRAKLGDATVKGRLKQLLQTRTQNKLGKKKDTQAGTNTAYADRSIKTADIISALSCITEPNEAAREFLDYIWNRHVADLVDNNKFFDGLPLLPAAQARIVLKAYLDKALARQPSADDHIWGYPDRLLRPLFYLVGTYGDSQIAQDVLQIMLLDAENADYFFRPYEISPYLTIASASLLKQGLDSKNSDMRAWCVWQLRKVGYKFDKTELDKLMRDENWKVRANTAFAGGRNVVSLAAKDKNALVRLLADF